MRLGLPKMRWRCWARVADGIASALVILDEPLADNSERRASSQPQPFPSELAIRIGAREEDARLEDFEVAHHRVAGTRRRERIVRAK